VSVATHLGIRLSEYDARIRTFIPFYEEMLDVAAAAVPPRARRIVDLGTGTGALAARCLARAARAVVVGIDADGDILEAAERRLGPRASFVIDSFLRAPLPPCDAVVASLALHHVRTRSAKRRLYQRIQKALNPGGVLVIVDCQPSPRREIALQQRDAWIAHLRRVYSARQAHTFLKAWAAEDAYVPLDIEMELIAASGIDAEVVWRKGAFAVIAGRRRR
jgi:trans-aconitate methyltransferase